MKAFKIIDCIVQVFLILGSIFFYIAPVIGVFNAVIYNYLIYCYVLVGGWQVISVLIHLFIPSEYKVGLRRVYEILLLITAVLFAISLFAGQGLAALGVLLYWSPILAIIYVTACLLELKKLNTSFEQQ